jgi:hypothetical protein
MNTIDKENIYEKVKKYCKILYIDECPWCIGGGWYDLMYDFSLLCEEINLRYYKKYRYRISLTQVKEKYGNLRIYFEIVKDPPAFITYIINMLEKIDDLYFSKNTNEYDFKKIIDENPHKKITFSILNDTTNKDEYIFTKNTIELDNKLINTSIVHNLGKWHYIPTKHKFKYMLKKINNWLINKLNVLFSLKNNNYSIYEILHLNVSKLVNEYEQKSSNICEECGLYLHDEYNKKCTTIGWVRILCENCAKKSNQKYYMDNKIFKNGELYE